MVALGVSGQVLRISYDAGFVVGLTLASASVFLLAVVMFFWLRRRLSREKALLERDATSRHLIDHARDAIITLDETGLVIYFNPAAEAMFGYRPEEAVGVRFQALIPAPYGVSLEAPVVREVSAIRKDGSEFAADLMLSELQLSGRSLLSAIVRDATERKQAELALRAERTFTSAILDAAAALIVVIDQKGKIVHFNRFAQAITGYPPEEAIGASFVDLLLAAESDEVKASLTTPSGQVRQVVEECWCQTRKGLRKIVWTATSFLDAKHNHLVCVGTDVTDRRVMEARLLQSEKMQAVGRLAGGIAHDFNNLLTAINGYSELLLDSIPNNSPLRRDLLEIQAAGERAASLTRQLLTFSRGQVARPAVVDLNAIAVHMEGMLGRLIGEHVRLVLNLDPKLGHIRADRSQMEQVLLNLVLNARDAMPLGGT
ncbi:MAG: PAS domain S-box protein, partial [Acidobacteria bacterium]|nr:PAS domain S-box protein [Acidobacteriota bacterium]